MVYIKFLLKVIIVCLKEEIGLNYKKKEETRFNYKKIKRIVN